MERFRIWVFGLAALLLAPGAALAQPDPERLNGVFLFQDDEQNVNNTLEFELDGRSVGASGEVVSIANPDVVTIRYRTDFPDKLSAPGNARASLAQGRQVFVELEVVPGMSSSTPAYLGDAAPNNCRVSAKITGTGPNNAQAVLKCDLGGNMQELRDTGDQPPPAPVLTAVEQAFVGRKDVKLGAGSGRLQVRHKGTPVD